MSSIKKHSDEMLGVKGFFIYQKGLRESDTTMMGFSIYNLLAADHMKEDTTTRDNKQGWAPPASNTECEKPLRTNHIWGSLIDSLIDSHVGC